MSITKVANLKNGPFDVYIGRPSKWGNPYSHKEGTLAEFKVSSRKEFKRFPAENNRHSWRH